MRHISLILSVFLLSISVYGQEPDLPAPIVPLATAPAVVTAEVDLELDIGYLDEAANMPHSDMYNFLSTAVAQVNSLPDDLSTDSNGTSLVPNETATQLFGYAKWMFSYTALQEMLGATLAPIGLTVYSLLLLMVFGAIVWFTIRIAILIYRFVVAFVDWILKILPVW